MADIIEFLETSAVAVFVRESPSIFGYTAVLSLHAMGLAIVVGVGATLSLRLLGVARGIPLAPLLKLYPLMYVGFTINALSGMALLAANAGNMLANTLFLIKMAMIVVAVTHMELLRSRLLASSPELGAGVVSTQTRVLAAGALVSWSVVVIAGRLTAYPNFVTSLFGLGT